MVEVNLMGTIHVIEAFIPAMMTAKKPGALVMSTSALLVDDEVTIAIQIAGKLRDTMTLAKGIDKGAAEAAALARPRIVELLGGTAPKKVIVVPDRLVNIVP